MNIKINEKPFSIDKWYSGKYIKDNGDELEYKEELYKFTIHSMDNGLTLEITWIDEEPDDSGEIEDEIKQKFSEL